MRGPLTSTAAEYAFSTTAVRLCARDTCWKAASAASWACRSSACRGTVQQGEAMQNETQLHFF